MFQCPSKGNQKYLRGLEPRGKCQALRWDVERLAKCGRRLLERFLLSCEERLLELLERDFPFFFPRPFPLPLPLLLPLPFPLRRSELLPELFPLPRPLEEWREPRLKLRPR